ncbi:MAG: hypothetical protein HOM73_02805 [Micrococcales bacterium]|jgi:hypothetical protein|nr:hypothetical protein [Micrococcales bacterium]
MEIPNTPVLAKLPYKSAIKKAQAEVDELYSAWVEEDSIWEELKAQLEEARVLPPPSSLQTQVLAWLGRRCNSSIHK